MNVTSVGPAIFGNLVEHGSTIRKGGKINDKMRPAFALIALLLLPVPARPQAVARSYSAEFYADGCKNFLAGKSSFFAGRWVVAVGCGLWFLVCSLGSTIAPSVSSLHRRALISVARCPVSIAVGQSRRNHRRRPRARSFSIRPARARYPGLSLCAVLAADRRVLLHEPVLDRPCIETADGCL